MYRKLLPCGRLYSQNQTYLLIHPEPIVKDSWQDNGTYRFLVTPDVPRATNTIEVYPSLRHIVTTSFLIEYITGLPEITILVEDQDTEFSSWMDELIVNQALSEMQLEK